MNQDYILFLLPLCIGGAAGGWFGKGTPKPQKPAEERPHEVKINGFFDTVTTRVADYLKKNGYEPYFLHDHYIINFPFKDPLNIQWNTRLGIYSGEVRNLSTIHRDGEATLQYNNVSNALELRAHVAFDKVEMDYSFAAQFMNFGPRGIIHADVKDLKANFAVAIFPKTFKAELQEFNLKEASDIDVDVRGLGLFNDFFAIVADKFTDVYKGTILKIIEEKVREQAKEAIASFQPSELG